MDTKPKSFPEKPNYPVSLLRGDRKRERTNRAIASKGILVNPGENIQAAVDSVEKDGGGMVSLVAGTHPVNYMIDIPSGIIIEGAGRDVTLIDFQQSEFGVTVGDGVTFVRNVGVTNLTIENSQHPTGALDVNAVTGLDIDNTNIAECTGIGIRIKNSFLFNLNNILISDITGKAILIDSTDSGVASNFNITNLDISGVTGIGIHIDADSNPNLIDVLGNFTSCRVASCTSYGVYITGGGETNIVFNACDSRRNTGDNWLIETELNTFVACNAVSSISGRGFVTTAPRNRLIGCTAKNNVGAGTGAPEDYDLANGTVFIGNIYGKTDTLSGESFIDAVDKNILMAANYGGDTVSERDIKYMQNKNGDTRTAGEVVSYRQSSNVTGSMFVSPATQGEDFVAGMLLESTIDGNIGAVLMDGYTDILKVNGTDDIVIGDFLSAYSTGGVSAKARDGDMAFAIALEQYTSNDSSGVIRALLIKPRKVGAYSTTAALTSASGQSTTGETLGGSFDDISNFEATGTFTSGRTVLIVITCQYATTVIDAAPNGRLKLRDATASTDLRTYTITDVVSTTHHFSAVYVYTIPTTASRRFVVQGIRDSASQNSIAVSNPAIAVVELSTTLT